MAEDYTYSARIEALRTTKMAQTEEKWRVVGAMDYDDWALVLPPPDRRRLVRTVSPSGVPITDVLLDGYEPESNHPSGGFFGPKAVGRNFRRLLEAHPVYLDPSSSLAGAYMTNFASYRKPHWNPDLDYAHLRPDQAKYKLGTGIGGMQHFCQDFAIGLELGWGGLQKKIAYYRAANPAAAEFYDGLAEVVMGVQDWIRRHATEARRLATIEMRPAVRRNLEEIAAINEHLATEPPRTFREACQFILWYQIVARMYNGSGSLGRLDGILCLTTNGIRLPASWMTRRLSFTSPACWCATQGIASLADRAPMAGMPPTRSPISCWRQSTPCACRPTSACAWGRRWIPGCCAAAWSSSSRTRSGFQSSRRGKHRQGVRAQRLSAGDRAATGLFGLSLVGPAWPRVHHERHGQDQPGGCVRGGIR